MSFEEKPGGGNLVVDNFFIYSVELVGREKKIHYICSLKI